MKQVLNTLLMYFLEKRGGGGCNSSPETLIPQHNSSTIPLPSLSISIVMGEKEVEESKQGYIFSFWLVA